MIEIDFETFSELDVRNVGSHAYFRHPSTEILMMAYSIDDGPVDLWVPDGPWDYDSIPENARYQLENKEVWAHNIEFEYNGLRHCLGIEPRLSDLRDTAILALRYGYPKSLDGAAAAVGLGVKKDTRGTALKRRFCAPRKPTKNNKSTRNWACDFPDEWSKFCDYCRQDVVVESELRKKLLR